MEKESFLDKTVEQQPQQILEYLTKKYNISDALSEEEKCVQTFVAAYREQARGAGEKYVRKQTSADYEAYRKGGALPGYIHTTYKELIRQDKARAARGEG